MKTFLGYLGALYLAFVVVAIGGFLVVWIQEEIAEYRSHHE